MPIVYEGYGNILTHPAQTITCPVNTVAVMGAGLALAMRNRIPGLHAYYKSLCYQGDLTLGECRCFQVPRSEKQVLLFPTKGHWKESSREKEIEKGLQYLTDHLEAFGIEELAMIPLGCGLGELNYTKVIRPLLVEYLESLPIDVHLLHRMPN